MTSEELHAICDGHEGRPWWVKKFDREAMETQ